MAVRYGLASLVLLGVLAHTGFSAHRNFRITAQAYVAGYENWTYNTARWQHSETLSYLRDTHIDGRIYSNKSALAWFADRIAALGKYQRLPSGMGWPGIEAGSHVVWFDKSFNRTYLSHDDIDIRLLPGVETVAELPDGVVLRRTMAEPFDAKRHRAQKQRYVNQLIEQAGERVVRSSWDVYLGEGKLTYVKEPCAPDDVQAKFVLHVTPADPADLPAIRRLLAGLPQSGRYGTFLASILRS